MKKLLLFSVAVLAFAFNTNQTYECKTLGISFKKNNQTYNIPNNKKTVEELKKTLNNLYTVKIKPQKQNLEVYIGKNNDTLVFVKNLTKNVSVYKTVDSQLFIMLDNNSSQIGINIPSQNMIIYYQCR